MRLVLASTSAYRAAVLHEASIAFEAVAPLVDERSYDHRFEKLGPDAYVVELARAKARSVVDQLRAGDAPDARQTIVIGCDQIAVLTVDGGPTLLHKPGTAARAVEQLMMMSGSAHALLNGVVAIDLESGDEYHEVDRHRITMRSFDEAEATRYVRDFAPLDCAGSYRIEDDADLLADVEGEHRSGIIGLPLPTLGRLLAAAEKGHCE
ncbi:MAG: septum formation inhibitor Maf [Actinobacteria bacterium]|nr:septum formation inhibitor Maf [Actinomycetota bacterium]